MRWAMMVVAGILCVAGCAAKKSSLLLERRGRGALSEEPTIGKATRWTLTPVMQTQTKAGVEVTVTYASQEFLRHFFANKEVFGPYAGKSPFYPEHLVFYVSIANRSDAKILSNPGEFVLVDDLGTQYATVGVDYVTAFGEYRKPMATTTRGVLEGASPGYFGVSVPVGRLFVSKPQGPFALLQQSAMQRGFLYPGVVHDGMFAFWSPSRNATTLRLVLTNLKTDFSADELPRTNLEFAFEFHATHQ